MFVWIPQGRDAELFTATPASDGKSGECNASFKILNWRPSFEMHYASYVLLIPLPAVSKSLERR